MSVKAAEYYGRCQACDRLQKLPNGVLAKHGYQVVERGNDGYFSGTCKGSDHSPYEETCDWIKNYLIPQAKKEEHRLADFCDRLSYDTPSEPEAYHHCYTRHSGYFWKKVRILGAPEYEQPHLELPGDIYGTVKIQRAGRYTWLPSFSDVNAPTLMTVAMAMNQYYADHIERTDLRRIRNYIKWQEKRVADWKLRPLPPVDKAKELRKQLNKEFDKREIEFVAA